MANENILCVVIPQEQGFVVEKAVWEDNQLCLFVKNTLREKACPGCGQPSKSVHSYYSRRVKDLPLVDKGLVVELRARRFRCGNVGCSKKTFSEPFGDFLAPYARITQRLNRVLEQVGLMVGANPGARLLECFKLEVSSDRLLAVVHAMAVKPVGCPRVIGVDEFALKRGIHYGSVIVDLRSGQPVDLLPSRDTTQVSEWLGKHPQIETVARDRSKEFALAISTAIPHAQQVLDRWHLLKNLRETLERELGQIHQQLKQKLANNGKIPRSRKDKTQQEASLFKRRELFARIRKHHQEGTSISKIARTLKVARGTVHLAIRADGLPEARKNRKRKTSLDGYQPYLKQRFSEGCRVAQQLWIELKEQGYSGSYAPVRRWVYLQKHVASQSVDPTALQTTPKQLTYLLLQEEQTLKEDQKKSLNDLCYSLPVLDQLRELTLLFKEALLHKLPGQMDQWLEKVKAAPFTFLRAFADGLVTEWDALKAACTLPWSNGPTEGLVNRIKLVKRQMYGRGSFDLLRKRVLLTSS